MKETFRMWQIVSYLYKNQSNFIIWDDKKERKFDNTGEIMPQFFQELLRIGFQNREPRVRRLMLASKFGYDQYWSKPLPLNPDPEKENPSVKEEQEKIKTKIADAQLRISSCIDADFFKEDKDDNSLIYLTLKGKKFASVFGLVKEWMVEDVGQLWSAIGAAIVVFGAIKFGWLINLIKNVLDLIR